MPQRDPGGAGLSPAGTPSRPSPLTRNLDALFPLTETEKAILDEACSRVVRVPAGEDVVKEGERPTDSNVLLAGMVFRYRLTPDGRRQILSFHVPGDVFDSQSFLLDEMDHSVATLTPCEIGVIPHKRIRSLLESQPRIGLAIWKATLVDAAIFREWMVSLGRRSSQKALAHLFCELVTKCAAVGLAENLSIELPLTQAVIGDALGISGVHVNRTLQDLRSEGLITLTAKRLVVHDWERLKELADFNPRYLQLRPDLRPGQQPGHPSSHRPASGPSSRPV